MIERVTVERLPCPSTDDRLDEVIRLLGLLCKAQGVRIAPVKPMSAEELEGWKRIGREFGDVARTTNESRVPREADDVLDGEIDYLPKSGGTPPPRLRRKP